MEELGERVLRAFLRNVRRQTADKLFRLGPRSLLATRSASAARRRRCTRSASESAVRRCAAKSLQTKTHGPTRGR